MIGKIKGILTEVEENEGLIETNSGLSYRVFLTTSVLTSVFPPSEIEVITYLQVRDDAHVLFGFKTKKEYKLFKLLLDVPGVGPKSAFTIVSFSKVEELITAVQQQDLKYFTRIPSLGKKTAMKIMLELSGKFDTEFKLDMPIETEEDKMVIDALSSLGFKVTEARKVLEQISSDLEVEKRVQKAIQILSGGK
ncbi:MAG TPA: Holliday junction branch migration protein RuvA [Candidatus Woesebacteria bacterium]|nr:Holliday junction branch migration protein RuvA [Candidatus Woesebacteria bacterium]